MYAALLMPLTVCPAAMDCVMLMPEVAPISDIKLKACMHLQRLPWSALACHTCQ